MRSVFRFSPKLRPPSFAEPRWLGGLVATFALAFGAGCDDGPRASEYAAKVIVHGDPGKAVAGAAVLKNGKEVGSTDLSGTALVKVRGQEGDAVDLTVRCPAGFESPRKAVSLRLKKTTGQKAPEYTVSCTPALRHVVVAVRADGGAHVPITYLGKPVGRTDETGAAHLLLRMRPGDQFELGLDTSLLPKHRPQNPKASFLVAANADELQHFDVRFDVERPKPVARFVPKRPMRL